MSARTVTVGRRSRCQTMPSSNTYVSVAICESGTTCRSCRHREAAEQSRRVRSSSVPRSNISISSLPSRYVLTCRPDSDPDRNVDSPAVLTPSTRARSWSISRRTTLLGSSQSRLTLATFGLARTFASTCLA
jgi:hypothetical protein